jgi:phosphatidyl-N-methylethanolamine N-methyltransferase
LILLAAAILLSFERIAYILVWRRPEAFRVLCERVALGPPVLALRRLFYAFKAIQGAVFLGWCYYFGAGSYSSIGSRSIPIAVGAMLIALGQTFNFGVFYRLGTVGVFYGNRFGHEVEWCREFPFSILDHPQYVGALLSIWGFFIAMRYPASDWYLLPVLETVYYAIGGWLES